MSYARNKFGAIKSDFRKMFQAINRLLQTLQTLSTNGKLGTRNF